MATNDRTPPTKPQGDKLDSKTTKPEKSVPDEQSEQVKGGRMKERIQ
jgi:hypothetical protein